MSHSVTYAIMKSGFRNPIQHGNFVDGVISFPELIESSSHGFLTPLQVGAALGAAGAVGLTLALRHAVLNFFLGMIIPTTHMCKFLK